MRLRGTVLLILGIVAAVGVAAGAVANGRPAPGRRITATPTPRVAISPRTGLVGGERLHVVVSGFPPDFGVGLSECPSPAAAKPLVGCSGVGVSLSTDAKGSAEGTFPAQVSVRGARGSPLTACTTHCVIAAAAYKASVVATSQALSFRVPKTGGLVDSSLVDMSWVSAEDGWALAQRSCEAGTCAVVARTTDAGERWTELPGMPALVPLTTGCTTIRCTRGVRAIAFASATIGYLCDPGMFMTTDGGQSWQALRGPTVASLAVGEGRVFRIVYPHTAALGRAQRRSRSQ